jgi:hypothetical protein
VTEAEWLTATDPEPMLTYLRGRASRRRLRLLAVACCRRVWHALTHPTCRLAVELAEKSVDGEVSDKLLDSLSGFAQGEYEDATADPDDALTSGSADVTVSQYAAACAAASYASNTPTVRDEDLAVVMEASADAAADGPGERAHQVELLRDVFGPLPFRSVQTNSAWLTTDVVPLAAGIYYERAFDRMPILADALQDAGCDNDDILNHCRSGGPHVRGCWVIDLLLGKK